MPSSKNVQNTHKAARFRDLHTALIEIVGAINKPQRDEALLAAAGAPLDRALFPLLVGIERFQPIGVVELADGVGRDYTTISRQLAKLESLGLVARQDGAADRRIRQAVVTRQGQAMIARIDAARARFLSRMFADWDAREVAELTRLMRKFADAWRETPPPSAKRDEA
jgi:DNA-binding MarR family transcriptional regulator